MNRPEPALPASPVRFETPPRARPRQKRGRLHRLARLLGFAVAHTVFVALALMVQARFNVEPSGVRYAAVWLIFTGGAFLGALATWLLCSWFAWRLRWSARAALIMIGLTGCTLAAAAFLHFLQFRAYLMDYHGAGFSVVWLKQNIYVGLNSAGLFAMFGLRYLLPVGLAALFASTALFLWMTRRRDL